MKKVLNSKGIKISSLGSLIIKFLSVFFTFLSSIVLTRILGLEGFGVYSLAYSTAILISVPVSLGLPNLITRYISKYEVENNKSAIKGLLISSNRVVLFTTFLILIIAVLSYYVWWQRLDLNFIKTLWVSFIIIPLLALSSIKSAALTGLKYIVLGQLPNTLLRNFLIFTVFLYFYILDLELRAYEAMLIHALAALISYAVGAYFLHIKLLKKVKKIKPTFNRKVWIKEAIPFSLNGGIQVIRTKAINYVLVVFGSFEAVAIFDVATRGAGLVSFTLGALNSAIAPYISSAYESNNQVRLQNILRKSSRVILFSSLPIALLFMLGGESLIALVFGNEYKHAFIPLFILCVGKLISAICGSVGLVLSMTGRQSFLTKVNFYSMLINVILGIPLVKYFDVNGASVIISLVLIIQNITLYFYVKKTMGVSTTVF